VFVKNLCDLGSGSQSSPHQTYRSGMEHYLNHFWQILLVRLKRRLSRTHAHIHITQRLCSSLKERTRLELPVWRRIQSFVLKYLAMRSRSAKSSNWGACWSASASLLVRALPLPLPLNAGFAGGWPPQWKWASLGEQGSRRQPGINLRQGCLVDSDFIALTSFFLCLKLAWDILQRKRLTLSSPAFLVRKG